MASGLMFDLMFAYETFKDLTGLGFGLMSPASRGKIKSSKSGNVGGIDLVDLIMRVVDGALKGQKLTTSGH